MPRLPAVKRFLSNTGVRIYRIPCDVLPRLSGRVYLLLEAGAPTLVDTGSGLGASTQQILQGIDSVRDEFGEAVRPSDIGRILLTHAHIDHYGGLDDLLRRTSAQVAIHPLDARQVEAYDEQALLGNLAFQRFLKQAGVEQSRRERLIADFGRTPGRVRSVPVDLALNDGDRLDGIEVIHTPGHSPGHVCLRLGNILLSGDHILARTIPQQWPESLAAHTGLSHYLDSLKRIEEREGIELILGGHEPPIHEPARRIEEIRQAQHRRLRRVAEILRNSPQPLTIDQITETMYSRQQGFPAMLALTDVGSRVEYLAQRGRLAVANLDQILAGRHTAFRYELA